LKKIKKLCSRASNAGVCTITKPENYEKTTTNKQ